MATLLAATRAAGQEFFGQGWTTDYPDADINFSIQFWRQSGGGTSERGEDSAEVHLRGIMDADGRIMVLMTHNTDISDAWSVKGKTRSSSTASRRTGTRSG